MKLMDETYFNILNKLAGHINILFIYYF